MAVESQHVGDVRADAEQPERMEEEEEAAEEEEEQASESVGELPEMLQLIDAVEESQADPAALAAVLRDIGRRARRTPADRELLSDFEGIAQICKVLGQHPHNWKGDAMLALCRAMPDICRTSAINRGALRDEGAVGAVVDFLREGLEAGSESSIIAASIALNAMCTANDASKKAAAQLRGDFNEDELVDTDANDPRVPLFKDPSKPGALDELLEVLRRFPDSVPVQTHALGALRCLLCDDDPRQASCVPSAVENRERAVSDEHFSGYREVVERALALKDGKQSLLKLQEQAMLLLRELSCRQDRIHALVFEAKLLPGIEASLASGDERVVRASLAVIRAFAFSDDIKEQLAVESDVVTRCVGAVRQHLGCAAICEQGFGLFANLTMRKPHIATRLNGADFRVIAVGMLAMAKHNEKPGVVRSVLQTIRNVATQDDAAGVEVRETDLFEDMRRIIIERQNDVRWRSPIEIAKQFLREFRADEGVRQAAKYNEYY